MGPEAHPRVTRSLPAATRVGRVAPKL